MKRFGMGRIGGMILYLGLLSFLVIVWIAIFINIEEFSSQSYIYIILYGMFFLAYMIYGNDRDNRCYIELKDGLLYVKGFFRIIKIYTRSELTAKFVVRKYVGARTSALYPSLLIGTKLWDENYYRVNLLRHEEQPVVDDNVFIILNKKRLNALANWWQKEIELPNEKEWSEFCREWKKVHMHGVKEVEKFYGIIEDYNQSIQQTDKAED